MLERFFPDAIADSVYDIDFAKLYAAGYRGLLFDIDNTLVPHGAPADARIIRFFDKIQDIGFSCCMISNNKKDRVKSFCDAVNQPYIEDAHKPSPKGYMRAMEQTKTACGNTVFVGDQLFTDIYGAKRAGIRTILVRPIHPKEEIQIVLKRYLERIVLYFYRKQGGG
ncbi:MAG: YqeG family HAD IIIA-type phosphatase [Lachnospiraceae bacterium]